MSNLILGGGAPSAAYTIDQSLRFDGTQYLSRTPGEAGNLRTWTISFWTKLGDIVQYGNFINVGTVSSSETKFNWNGNETAGLNFKAIGSGSDVEGDALYRDPSAWYNVVLAVDTTQAVDSNRVKWYVNGDLITSFNLTGYPSLNADLKVNSTAKHNIGRMERSDTHYLSGYLAEYYLIDGTALDADSFGETSTTTNQWIPKDASGLTFGSQGCYLKFEDSADLGNDSSGNDNDWTVTNLVATDQVPDSPTNNFSTLNSLDNYYFGSAFSEGNLKLVMPDGAYSFNTSTIGMTSGKWYWENYFVSNSDAGYVSCGVASVVAAGAANNLGNASTSWGYLGQNGVVYNNGVNARTGWSTYTDGDIVGIALDLDNNNLYFSKNNTWEDSGDPTSGATGTGAISITALSGGDYYYAGLGDQGNSSGPTALINFGQDSSFAGEETAQNNSDVNSIGDFYYTPPTDYLTLCTSNLSDPSIKLSSDNFNTVLYTGDGATSNAITGVGFQPDFLWIKNRTSAEYNRSVSVLRGATKFLASNSSTGSTTDTTMVQSFDSDGFTVGSSNQTNKDTDSLVSWNWKAGGAGVANTDGTNIDSVVSVNTTAGFSICTYTGTGTNDDSFGHGLASAPELVIVKRLDAVGDWQIGSNYIQASSDWTHVIELNLTGAAADSNIRWNDTAASASVVTLGTTANVNGSTNTYVAYCFHSVEGYSKVGSYVGNGNADGTFFYTGFRPTYIICKNVSLVSSWMQYDSSRSPYNVADARFMPNTSDAEATSTSFDFLSNGFKNRTSDADFNGSGSTYLYWAFAESPFKYSNAR
jgi:hypothetical protein